MTRAKSAAKDEGDPTRGPAKSGRFWKTQKERTTTMIKSKRKVGLKKLQALKEERERVKELSTKIIETRKAEKQEKRRREEENKKKREENARKSEVVQVIKNTAKLKRMKKKQLRKIEKRDTTVVQKDPPKPKPLKEAKMDTSS